MHKTAILILLAVGIANAAPPPWNNPLRRTEMRQNIRVDGRPADKAVKMPVKDVVESHYLLRNPEERDLYLSRRKIVAKPSQAKVPMRSSRDHDPDTGTYYYVPTTP